MDNLTQLIKAAKGQINCSVVLKNARVLNVFTRKLQKANIGIYQDTIVGLGDYEGDVQYDLNGKVVVPGFIDGHVHLESSMVIPEEFSKLVVSCGTTTVVVDPHELANVVGSDFMPYIGRACNFPLDILMGLPSCVPATDLETSGAQLDAELLSNLAKDNPKVLGLAEMMNYPGVLFCVPQVLDKIAAFAGKNIDGHAPGLSGKDLNAYIAAGISNDHECTNVNEAQEKLDKGMYIMIREGSVAQDLEALLPLVTESNFSRCLFVTDDREPADLCDLGHINYLVSKAIRLGLNPLWALTMASWNAAQCFGLKKVGAVSPGYKADLAVLDFGDNDHLQALFTVDMVFKNGVLVAKEGKALWDDKPSDAEKLKNTVHLAPYNLGSFAIKAPGSNPVKVRVIQTIPRQLLTNEIIVQLTPEKNNEEYLLKTDPLQDIAKLAVLERHKATGNIGLGFVKGFGLTSGALASTVAHDSHNVVVLGTNDEDMLVAVQEIERMGGGLTVVEKGQVLASVPLPVAGLLSQKSLPEVRNDIAKLEGITKALGCSIEHPFMAMAFLSLPVIPSLKLTDKGLCDVNKFCMVPLILE